MKSMLDYSELDQWIQDLDELQRELQQLQTHHIKNLHPMNNVHRNRSNLVNSTQYNTTLNGYHRPVDENGDFFTISQNPKLVKHIHIVRSPPPQPPPQPPRPPPFVTNVRQNHTTPSTSPNSVSPGLRVPKLIVATNQAHELPSYHYSQVQNQVTYPTAQPKHGMNGREAKSVHWSNDIESTQRRSHAELDASLPTNHQQNPYHQIPEFPNDPSIRFSNQERGESVNGHFRSPSSRLSPPLTRRIKQPLEEFSSPVNLVDFTRRTNPREIRNTVHLLSDDNNHHFDRKITVSPPEVPYQFPLKRDDRSCPDKLGAPRTIGAPQIHPRLLNSYPQTREMAVQYSENPNVPSGAQSERKHTKMNDKSMGRGQLILRVYQPDRTTKAIAIESNTTTFDVIRVMLSKNLLNCSTKHALVEKVPSMKLERCFEDSEILMDCLINWNVGSENLVFFEEREDMYGMFENPRVWLSENFPITDRDFSSNAAKNVFLNNGELNLPEYNGHLYVRAGGKNWKRRFCLLRNSGLYLCKKNSKDISEFHRLFEFQPYLHIYTTTGGWKKLHAPTPFGFTIRPFSAQPMDTKHTIHFCAPSEESLRIWYSLLRLSLVGPRLMDDFSKRIDYVNKKRVSRGSSMTNIIYESIDNEGDDWCPFTRGPRTASLNRFQGASSDGSMYSRNAESACSVYSNQSELGCVTGRSDVRSSTRSMNELGSTGSKRSSFFNSSSFSSLFLCKAGTAYDGRNTPPSNPPSPLLRRSARKQKKPVISGPASRRCTRSIGHISAPFNATIPTQIRERSVPLPTQFINPDSFNHTRHSYHSDYQYS